MISFNVSPKMRSSDYKYAMAYQVDHKKETKITQLTANLKQIKYFTAYICNYYWIGFPCSYFM